MGQRLMPVMMVAHTQTHLHEPLRLIDVIVHSFQIGTSKLTQHRYTVWVERHLALEISKHVQTTS